MALLAKGTWIVVADGEKAMILENEGTPADPKLRMHKKFEQEALATQDLADDRPGRIPDTGKRQLSAMEAPDLHRQAKERFVIDLASYLNTMAAKGKLGRLVLAAPPQSLSVLRDHLSAGATGLLIATLPKTFTHQPLDRIGALVASEIDPL